MSSMFDVSEFPRIDGGAEILDDLVTWFSRFIALPDARDVPLLALWTVSTHLSIELYTTPRLQIDSTMPGSGSTTVLDHFSRLAYKPVQAATLSSSALLPRPLASVHAPSCSMRSTGPYTPTSRERPTSSAS